MKIGICTTVQNASSMTNGVPEYVEINITNLANMTEDEFVSYKKFIEENHLSVVTGNCFFPGTIRLCGNGFDIDAVEEYSQKALFRAADIGIDICVIGSGRARMVEEGENPEKCYEEFLEACRRVGDIAKSHSITVCIEPLNRNETNMITTVEEGAKFVRKLNHPNIRLLADFYHMAVEGEPVEVFFENRDIISHAHIANPEERKFPLATDAYDYEKIRKILKKSAYDERISIEASGKLDFKPYAEESVIFMKQIFE